MANIDSDFDSNEFHLQGFVEFAKPVLEFIFHSDTNITFFII